MSVAIAIGNDVDDLRNIEDTIKILSLTKESYDTPLTHERLDNIITWYSGIYDILTNPDFLSSNEEPI